MGQKDSLHPQKRDINVGFRVTKDEKTEIKNFCEDAGIDSISRFIRHAVDVYMEKK